MLRLRFVHSSARVAFPARIPGLPALDTTPKPINLDLLKQVEVLEVKRPAIVKQLSKSTLPRSNPPHKKEVVIRRHMQEIKQKILPTNWNELENSKGIYFL